MCQSRLFITYAPCLLVTLRLIKTIENQDFEVAQMLTTRNYCRRGINWMVVVVGNQHRMDSSLLPTTFQVLFGVKFIFSSKTDINDLCLACRREYKQ
jgi:hypothetical protein